MSATINLAHSENIVEMMRKRVSYPEHPSSVQVIETHISWVFLTDRHAYKLKKPVKFDFLDFSTPELRKRACLNEVRLNRRLAPGVYIGVLPILQKSAGRLALFGDGEPIDWLVHMRRLPQGRALDHRIRNGQVTVPDTLLIAKHLTDFYSRLLPNSIRSDAYVAALESHVRANGAALLDGLTAEAGRIRRIQTAQLRFLKIEEALIGSRAASGKVVEGHGDLRPEHIYVDGRPIIIDCIEFSKELRTLDIADELCFLGMESEYLGDRELGKLILAEYEKVSGDRVPASLLSFYRCYRASVRAKVAALRGEQQDGEGTASDRLAAEYLDLAERYAKELGPPILLVVGGLMGSGKSTLAAKLADVFAIKLLSTDHIRHGLIGSSEAPAGYGEGNYRPDMRHRVYDELFQQAEKLLSKGESVVLDGTFLTCCLRDRAYDLVSRHGAVALYVQCTCPRDVAYTRIQKRSADGQSESEARTELYDLQFQDLESPWADEPAISVDSTATLQKQIRDVCDKLKERLSVVEEGSKNLQASPVLPR
jgi:aminoglycoside phosphotransferase family enzyme/predicted kinase